jgi:hypothetical protein
MKLTLSRHSLRTEKPAESFRASPGEAGRDGMKVTSGGDFVYRPRIPVRLSQSAVNWLPAQ